MVREDGELEALLESCAQGDERALKALFDAEAARMKGIAMRVLHRSDMAEEAVQATTSFARSAISHLDEAERRA